MSRLAGRRQLLGLVVALVLLGVVIGRAVLAPEPPPRQAGRPEAAPTAEPPPSYVASAIAVMGTRIQLLVPDKERARASREVFEIFKRVDARMSEWKGTSPLSAVNRAAGQGAVKVPADLRALLRRGIEIGRRTDGAFDVTWAALWGLWDFKATRPRVPTDGQIAARRALVDYRRVELDEAAGTVRLPRAGMKLGLGAIGKGYALDQAAARLRAVGVDSFMIVAGGQVLAGGTRAGRPWRVGIRDPRGAPADYFAKIELTDSGVSTSGDYERFFVVDGRRYHHILDPRTGRPADSGLRSVSVVCADATLADALSTAMMILGRDKGLTLAEGWDGVEVVLVDASGKVHVTSGIGTRLKIRHAPAPR